MVNKEVTCSGNDPRLGLSKINYTVEMTPLQMDTLHRVLKAWFEVHTYKEFPDTYKDLELHPEEIEDLILMSNTDETNPNRPLFEVLNGWAL